MTLAVILVHYHTPELLHRAWQALQHDANSSGIDLEPIVIDNGSTAEEQALLSQLPIPIHNPGANLGYAGAVNLGMAKTRAPKALLMNPDVLVQPGCLEALITALQHPGTAAAGPLFYWDENRTFMLPPTEQRTRRAELAAVLAKRNDSWAQRGRKSWRRHAWTQWAVNEPTPCWSLSGALIAVNRDAWNHHGPFDDGYRLYFEETDWLERLRKNGAQATFVPQAQAIHLFAQSTVQEPKSEGWFQTSARRFRHRYYGRLFTGLLERLDRHTPQRPPPEPVDNLPKPPNAAWLELSFARSGYPAAGVRVDDNIDQASDFLHDDLKARLQGNVLQATWVDHEGNERSSGWLWL